MLLNTPTKIRLEASSRCQLRCPSCPTASGAINPAVGSGFLKLSDFQKFIEANSGLREIELSNYGEIFLNPDLLEIIRFAHRSNVVLSADNGVNLNHAREEVLEALVRYRFRSLTCSIDGASAQTYALYRVRGDFEKVIKNIEKINDYKRQHNTPEPRMTWQFVVFGHNEHEIEAAREMAQALQMKFYLKLSWDAEFSPVQNHEHIRQEIGAASREEWKEQHGADYTQEICHQLWDEPQINWDGKVLGCCRNFWGDFGGNAFVDGLESSLQHPKMNYAKAMLQGHEPARADIPCTTCDIYQDRKARNHWIASGPRFSRQRLNKNRALF